MCSCSHQGTLLLALLDADRNGGNGWVRGRTNNGIKSGRAWQVKYFQVLGQTCYVVVPGSSAGLVVPGAAVRVLKPDYWTLLGA
jgi:hypothetical protein